MLEILNETRQSLPPEVEAALQAYLDEVGVTQIVTVILCDDATIHKLNWAHRGVDSPTDVLSYPLEEAEGATMPKVEQLGDVFISLDSAARQAPEHGYTFVEEVLSLAAHGITHLLGFDHRTEEAWQTFHKAQKRARELYHARH